MARPCVARWSVKRANVKAASMYQTSGVEHLMLRARMGIRAHPTLTKRKTWKVSHIGTQSCGCAGQTVRPSPHSISQTSVGKLGELDGYLTFHFPLFIGSQVKPFPRSHRRSLAQSKIGERGWRRGRASIPLVNLSKRILCGIGRDPRFVVATTRKHSPGDAGELVGERDRQQIAVREALRSLLDPWPQGAHCRGGTPLDDDVGGLDKEGAEVLVAALGDPPELGAIAGRLLLRDEAEPGGEVASLLEAGTGTDGGHDGARDDRADTGHGHEALTGCIVLGEAFYLG